MSNKLWLGRHFVPNPSFDKNLEQVVEIETPASCVTVLYPPRMEQIFCGLSSGEVYCLLDDVKSSGGMIRPLLNNNKKIAVDDYDKVSVLC